MVAASSSDDYKSALAAFSAEIDNNLEFEEGYGRFTRAFIAAIFEHRKDDAGWNRLVQNIVSNPDDKRAFARWLDGKLIAHVETDADEKLQFIRLAAQGASLHFGLRQRSQIKIDFERLFHQLLGRALDADY